jgi:hypothetical protein
MRPLPHPSVSPLPSIAVDPPPGVRRSPPLAELVRDLVRHVRGSKRTLEERQVEARIVERIAAELEKET